MSYLTSKRTLQFVLVLQMIGTVVLLTSDFGSMASSLAFCVVIGGGIVEVALALRAKHKGEPSDG